MEKKQSIFWKANKHFFFKQCCNKLLFQYIVRRLIGSLVVESVAYCNHILIAGPIIPQHYTKYVS